jgi:hypothetical protein
MSADSSHFVSVSFGCVGCGVRLRAECERTDDGGRLTFYDLECPICGQRIRPFLPGPAVSVVSDQGDPD